MTDLLVLAREFDLPPKWDGLAAVWDGWEEPLEGRIFICPAPARSVCTACGSVESQVMNRALVAKSRRFTHDDIEGRKRGHQPGRVALYRLHAFRCPDCKQDSVWDMETDQWWDLDPTDYGPDGSVPPPHEPDPPAFPTRPRAPRAPRGIRTSSGTDSTRRTRATRRRHDGSCTVCDDLHQPGTPCGKPSPPPPGWRPALKGPTHG